MQQLLSARQIRKAYRSLGDWLYSLFHERSNDLYVAHAPETSWANAPVSVRHEPHLLHVTIFAEGIDRHSIEVKINGRFLSLACRKTLDATGKPGQSLRRTMPLPCHVHQQPIKIDCLGDAVELVFEKYHSGEPALTVLEGLDRSDALVNHTRSRVLH